MSRTFRLLNGDDVTYEEAKATEKNMVQAVQFEGQMLNLYMRLLAKRDLIEAEAASFLGLPASACRISTEAPWLRGSYNVCVPIIVQRESEHDSLRLIMRFPFMFRNGDDYRPGNTDEKIRCEAATYAWIKGTCPKVPLPKLYGFGLTTGQKFATALEAHVETDSPRQDSCSGQAFRTDVGPNQLEFAYLLVECIDESRGQSLSATWPDKRDDATRRENLFRGLSRLQLDLSKTPLPRIGSLTVEDTGIVTLSNRPLLDDVIELESQSVPLTMSRDFTYTTVSSYISDVLSYHDDRILYQPNAVNDRHDLVYCQAILAIMRAMTPNFFSRSLDRGPFGLYLSDLHTANIMVDQDWNVTCIVDLEWACSLPLEMHLPPYWFHEHPVDMIEAEEYDKYRKVYMNVMRAEEAAYARVDGLKLSTIMEDCWARGTFWYALALYSTSGIFSLCSQHLIPIFIKPRATKDEEDDKTQRSGASTTKDNQAGMNGIKASKRSLEVEKDGSAPIWVSCCQLWRSDGIRVRDNVLEAKLEYDVRLRHVFGLNEAPEADGVAE